MLSSKNYWKKQKIKKFNACPNVSLFRFLSEYGFKYLNKKVLELGFFHGADLLEFKKRKSDVYGIDINIDAVKNLRKKISKSKIYQTDLSKNKIPFKINFDLIFSRDFIYYLDENEIKSHFNDVSEKLKSNGLYLFQFIEKDLVYSKNKFHGYSFRKMSLNSSFAEKNNPVKFYSTKFFYKFFKKNFDLVGKKILIESYGIDEKKIRVNKYLLCKKK